MGYHVEKDFAAPRAGDVRASQADNSRGRELFPDVEPVSLEQGLAATIEWFKSERLERWQLWSRNATRGHKRSLRRDPRAGVST